MELLQLEPAQLWRLMIPPRMRLFDEDVPPDELIFRYRGSVYFVNNDGSVVALAEPAQLERMTLDRLLDCLLASEDTYDFDDNGVFDIGAVLRQMGYVVSCDGQSDRADYTVELVDTVAADPAIIKYDLSRVSFVFALYHALLRCARLNELAGGDSEFAVLRLEPCSSSQSHSERKQKIVYDDSVHNIDGNQEGKP